jgi:hypothetical protein
VRRVDYGRAVPASPSSVATRAAAAATASWTAASSGEGTSSPGSARAAMATAALANIRGSIARLRTDSAPRKSPGKASALLIERPSEAKAAPAASAVLGWISGSGFDSDRMTYPRRIISGATSPGRPVVAITMSASRMRSASSTARAEPDHPRPRLGVDVGHEDIAHAIGEDQPRDGAALRCGQVVSAGGREQADHRQGEFSVTLMRELARRVEPLEPTPHLQSSDLRAVEPGGNPDQAAAQRQLSSVRSSVQAHCP